MEPGRRRTFARVRRPAVDRPNGTGRGPTDVDPGRCVVRIAFVADPLESLDPSVDTSVGLMHAAQDRGAEVWITEVGRLEAVGGRARALARPVRLAPSRPAGGHLWAVPDPWYSTGEPSRVWL